MRAIALASVLSFAGSASAASFEWVTIGDPGNAPDVLANCVAPQCGSVPYRYAISKYEVTNVQYAELLNAKAASDPFALYDSQMGADAFRGGITRSGSEGAYTYTVKPGFANRPATYVSFYGALRFANWVNGGQGAADTETGAYTLTENGIASNTIVRNPGADVFLPSENEWYKAAYFDGVRYFEYPTGTDGRTVCAPPGPTPNTANCGPIGQAFISTDVGAYTASPSPYGTFDQGGNVEEWVEQIRDAFRVHRGGGLAFGRLDSGWVKWTTPTLRGGLQSGFRLAARASDLDDVDGDGVPNPIDDCPNAPDPGQEDRGGVGDGSAPDGIGDACQCGDVDGDGRASLADAVLIARAMLQPPTASLAQADRCDVGGSTGCSLADAVIVVRAVLQPPTATIQQVCPPAIGAP